MISLARMARPVATMLLLVPFIVLCSFAQVATEEKVEEPGLELLDQAATAKFAVNKLSDLDVVVGLCREALEKGLSPENQTFAKQMITATLYEKANRLVANVVAGGRAPGWAQQRRMAVSSLYDALEMDAEHAESHLLLARIDLLPGGEIERGRRSADRAVELLKDNPERYAMALVVRSAYQEDFASRLADLDRAIEADPQNVDAWRDRGRVHLINGQTEEAVADFEKLLEFDRDDVEAIDALTRALAIQEKYDDALELANQLIEKRPDAGEPYALRSSIHVIRNDFDKAMPDLDRAIELDPDDPRNWLARGRLHQAMEQWDPAMNDVDEVLRRNPGLVPALIQKVTLLEVQGQYGPAAETLRLIIQGNPDNPELKLHLARLHLAASELRDAIKVYSELIDSEEVGWAALRGRGDAYLHSGSHAEAIADYESALIVRPDDNGILNNLSWVLSTSTVDQLRDGQRALELAKRACEVTDYGEAHILSTLAAAYAELGDFEKAIEWSNKSIQLGEGEIKEQLENELKSYQARRPWREMITPETDEPSDDDITMDDLKLDTAARTREKDQPRIPKDP